MSRIPPPLLWASVILIGAVASDSARAASSCSADNGNVACTADCETGQTAVCYADSVGVSCICGGDGGAFPGELDVGGSGSGGVTVRFEVLDISCEVLPCTPSLVGSTSVATTPGLSAADLADAASSQLQTALSGTCTATSGTASGDGIHLACPGFYPKFRICDAALGTCPEDDTPGTGTSGDYGVALAGFSFKTVPPAQAVPGAGFPGLAFLGATLVASAAAARSSRQWRRAGHA